MSSTVKLVDITIEALFLVFFNGHTKVKKYMNFFFYLYFNWGYHGNVWSDVILWLITSLRSCLKNLANVNCQRTSTNAWIVQVLVLKLVPLTAHMTHQQRAGQVIIHSQGDQGGPPHGQSLVRLLMEIQGNSLHLSLEISDYKPACIVYDLLLCVTTLFPFN